MAAPFNLISQYFWLIALAFSIFNYRKALGMAGRAFNGQQAEEAAGYLKRFAIGSSMPWIVMGIGQMAGSTPTVWHYFRPQDGNPFVIGWLALIFLATCRCAYWVLFGGGASKVHDYNLMSVMNPHWTTAPSVGVIKLLAALAPLMVPLWVYLAVSMNVPLPR